MKLITKCIIDMKTSQVIYEESCNYNGPVAKCKGGGGGGSSGKVDYPDYMKNAHEDWLTQGGADSISDSVTGVMSSALGNSPWTTVTAYNPDTDISNYESAIADLKNILAGIVDTNSWDALYSQARSSIGDLAPLSVDDKSVDANKITDEEILLDVDAFADQLDDEIESKVLPRFEGGMRDINAVVSSAFVVGRSIIESFRNHEVAKHNSELRVNAALKNADIGLEISIANLKKDVQVGDINKKVELEYIRSCLEGSNQMLRLMLQRISFNDSYARLVVEGKRIKIVAKKEQLEADAKIDESDALWDLEVFQYGSNVLAAIGGGVGSPGAKEPSKTMSALGGAMSGAAAGAMVGSVVPGIGTAVGAIGGAILGAASSFA